MRKYSQKQTACCWAQACYFAPSGMGDSKPRLQHYHPLPVPCGVLKRCQVISPLGREDFTLAVYLTCVPFWEACNSGKIFGWLPTPAFILLNMGLQQYGLSRFPHNVEAGTVAAYLACSFYCPRQPTYQIPFSVGLIQVRLRLEQRCRNSYEG